MYFYDSVNNSITGGSIISKSSYDYGLHNALTTNNFANTNFTAARKIYFDDTTSWFNYNNVSTLTFGKTNIGGTSKSCYFGDTHLGKFTLNEDGTVTKITAYISGAWGNPATVRAGIYSDSAGSPSRVKGTTSNTVVSATAGWYNFTFSTPLSLTAGTYHIGFYSGDNDMVCYYDTGSTGQYNYNNWRDFRDPYPGGSTQNWDISVYATYTSGISTTSDIWLKTNVSAAATITRKLIRWNQYLMKWNDTSDSDITARYNLTGLALNEIYYVYNNSIRAYTLNSGPSGSLSFTIVLPQNQEREIKVKGICDYYIFSSDLPYTIAQNNSLYCAAENLYISGSNATIFASSIKNSTLDCKGKEIDSNDVTNTFGVYMRINTRNNTLKNCNISDFDTGIKLQNSYNNTIIKNVIYSNTNNIDFSYSVNNTISDNNLTQTPQENVYLWDSDKNIIENNIISESDNDGISFTAGSDENIMRNNTVINVNHGICITGGTSNKFYNNTIKWTTQMSNSRGFNLAGGSSIIENNTVSGVDAWGSSGIYLTGSNTRNNTIKNNNVSDFQYGIYSENGANNNTISSNTINSSTTYGIYLVLSSNDTLINNTINNSGNVGINFVSSYNNTITNSIITNSAWSGIYFYSSSNNSLTNNTANNNYNGIVFESTSNNNQLITNIVNNNNYVGITIMSSYNNSITGGSVSFSSLSDYFLQSVGTTNNFTNTNFTVGKSIYFYETTSWFNYNNETTGNIWLKTNVSSNYEHIKRKLIKWSQTLISWNDTSDDSTITARYNITGLALSTNYNIYNNSILAYPNQNSGPSGSLSFTIYLPVNEEHNITVTT
jgi:parallel beta-helix repeat protein